MLSCTSVTMFFFLIDPRRLLTDEDSNAGRLVLSARWCTDRPKAPPDA